MDLHGGLTKNIQWPDRKEVRMIDHENKINHEEFLPNKVCRMNQGRIVRKCYGWKSSFATQKMAMAIFREKEKTWS